MVGTILSAEENAIQTSEFIVELDEEIDCKKAMISDFFQVGELIEVEVGRMDGYILSSAVEE